MNFPDNLRYTAQHEWLRVEGSVGTVGITDFAQGELGDVVFLELPAVGKKVRQGESCGTIEAVKTVAELYSPVSGEIVEVNEKIKDSPEVVNKDPYGDGWMVKITLSDPKELSGLLTAEAYKKLVGH
jgi:glycine cleavage system H protein